MNFVESQKFHAKELQKTLVLPEGVDPRVMKAGRILLDEQLAKAVILLGNQRDLEKVAFTEKINLEGFTTINPAQNDYLERYGNEYYELRKHKGMTLERAKQDITDNIRFGAMMVHLNDADGMVAGAISTTAAVLLAGFTIVKTAPNVKSASSCFIMDVPNKEFGANGNLIFADCSTIIDPTAEELAEIAIASCDSCKKYLQVEPICAMLSFSTMGSANHALVNKVRNALAIVKTKRPDLNIDGELQLDAAIIPEVAKKKAPASSVAGKANVLIFPDLQSGNIGYKLVQRFAGAGAYGPFMQGFAKPISDLSRGATVDDIVNTCAVVLSNCEA